MISLSGECLRTMRHISITLSMFGVSEEMPT